MQINIFKFLSLILLSYCILIFSACGPKIQLKKSPITTRPAKVIADITSDFDFQLVVVNSETPEENFLLTNSDSKDLTNCMPSILGGDNPSDFSLSDNCETGGTISNCIVKITAHPTSEAIKTATLTKVCDDAKFIINLSATGISDFSTFELIGNSTYSDLHTSSSTPSIVFTGNSTSVEYCLTEDSSGATCDWVTTISSGITTYTFSNLVNGNKTVFLFKKDDYDNLTSGISASIIFDNTAPTSPTISDPTSSFYNQNTKNFTFTNGTDDYMFAYLGKACLNSGCNSGCTSEVSSASSPITYINLSDDAFYFCLQSLDYSGQTSSYSVTSTPLTIDTTPPVLTFTSTPTALLGNGTFDVMWTLTENNVAAGSYMPFYFFDGSAWSKIIDATVSSGGPLTNASHNYLATVPNSVITNAKFRVTYIDQALNPATTDSAAFVIDNTAPTVSSLTINSGSVTTISSVVEVDFSATDDAANITHFCFKYDSTSTPSVSDTCWVSVSSPLVGLSPSTSINISAYHFLLGLSIKSYDVYGFAKNELGLISSLSNSGNGTHNIDKDSIAYDPLTPPSVNNIITTNTDVPTNPPTTGELTISSTSDLYIKWYAADANGLIATPMSIYTTTDDINYTLVADNLLNGANGVCTPDDAGTTLDDGNTGCYVVSTPITDGSYFRVRVGAENGSNYITFSSSQPLNTSAISFLAGNTDSGINGVATSATFVSRNNDPNAGDVRSFVVKRDGTILFIDKYFGILEIDPLTKIVSVLIPTTGTMNGDGTPYTTATLADPVAITLDYNDDLLIMDNYRIRKVDFNSGLISTIIGGGTSTANTIANPLDTKIVYGFGIWNQPSIIPMPNGDIYFSSDPFNSPADRFATGSGGWKIRKYSASTGSITSIVPTGAITKNSTSDLTTCVLSSFGIDFNTTTSAINYIYVIMQSYGDNLCADDTLRLDTSGNAMPAVQVAVSPNADPRFSLTTNSRDGKILISDRGNAKLSILDSDTPAFSVIYGGTSSISVCADDVTSTSCGTYLYDAFRDENGNTFVQENGVIRFIDQNDHIQTLYGQRKNFGDGGLAINARFDTLEGIAYAYSGNIYVLDKGTNYFRKFTRGGNISLVAGDGSFNAVFDNTVVTSMGIDAGTWWGNSYFVIDPLLETIFYGGYSQLFYYNPLVDNKWHALAGLGNTGQYFFDSTADGVDANNLLMRMPTAIGYDTSDNRVLSIPNNLSPQANMIKTFDATGGTQRHIAGIVSNTPSFNPLCSDGDLSSTCDFSWWVQAGFVPTATYDTSTDGSARWLMHLSTTNYLIDMSPGGTKKTVATVPRTFSSFAYHRFSGPTKEILWYCDESNFQLYQYNITDATETPLSWPISAMRCGGKTIIYDSTNDSLIFPYSINGLSGVAEHFGIYPNL